MTHALKQAFGIAVAAAALVVTAGLSETGRSTQATDHGDFTFFASVASDGAAPGYSPRCIGDIGDYFNQDGALRVVRNSVIAGTDATVLIFEFTNPCNAPISPAPLTAFVFDGTARHDVTMNGWPSLLAPGHPGFYAMVFDKNGDPIDNPRADVPAQDREWDELLDLARALTVDANGNDANSPQFNAANIAQFGFGYELAVTAYNAGNLPAWPAYLWLRGACDDGSLGIGRFFPRAYGYNSGATRFDGYTSWLGCQPDRPSITGPYIDDLWMEAAVGAQQNTILLDDLTLEQTTATTFRLAANVINTNSVAGRPAAYNFTLIRSAGSPFSFSVPGTETWFPGIQGSIAINNIPGDVDDFTSISGTATGTVATANLPVPGWALNPTWVWSDGTPFDLEDVLMVVVPNTAALKAAVGPAGSFTVRSWVNLGNSVHFVPPSTVVPLAALDDEPFVVKFDRDDYLNSFPPGSVPLRSPVEEWQLQQRAMAGYTP